MNAPRLFVVDVGKRFPMNGLLRLLPEFVMQHQQDNDIGKKVGASEKTRPT